MNSMMQWLLCVACIAAVTGAASFGSFEFCCECPLLLLLLLPATQLLVC
jgi:hypothetical protein